MPKTATQSAIALPGFSYGGIDNPAYTLDRSLYNDLGPGEPAHVLSPRSAPLSLKVSLYRVGRDLVIGINNADSLPEPVKEAGRLVYEDGQKRVREGSWTGHWHKDGVIIEPKTTIPGNARPGPDYVVGIFFQNIDGFEESNGVYLPKTTPDTVEEKLWLPPGGGRFIVPRYGANNRFGIPDETVESDEEARKLLEDAGLPTTELSQFYRGREGTFAVYSGSGGDVGPLSVGLNGGPGYGVSGVGSFPASRSAGRSEAGR